MAASPGWLSGMSERADSNGNNGSTPERSRSEMSRRALPGKGDG